MGLSFFMFVANKDKTHDAKDTMQYQNYNI